MLKRLQRSMSSSKKLAHCFCSCAKTKTLWDPGGGGCWVHVSQNKTMKVGQTQLWWKLPLHNPSKWDDYTYKYDCVSLVRQWMCLTPCHMMQWEAFVNHDQLTNWFSFENTQELSSDPGPACSPYRSRFTIKHMHQCKYHHITLNFIIILNSK